MSSEGRYSLGAFSMTMPSGKSPTIQNFLLLRRATISTKVKKL